MGTSGVSTRTKSAATTGAAFRRRPCAEETTGIPVASSAAAVKPRRNPRWHYGFIPLHVINVLPRQPRSTFERIEDLAESVATDGFFSPPIVVRYTEGEARGFLEDVALYWRAQFDFSSLISVCEEGEVFYYILLAGERRIRAVRYLYATGCEACRKLFSGPVPTGACLRRHFANDEDLIEVRLTPDGLDFDGAFRVQLTENTAQDPVPLEQQAIADRCYLLRKLKQNPRYSIRRMAKETGRKESDLRNSLMFCDLPLQIQEAVWEKRISFSIAIQIGRYRSEVARAYKREGRSKEEAWSQVSDDELIQFMKDAILYRWSEKKFRKIVNMRIAEQAGQLSFSLVAGDEDYRARMRRQGVAGYASKSFRAQVDHILFLIGEHKKLEWGHSPLTSKAAAKDIRRLAEEIVELSKALSEVKQIEVDPELVEVATQAGGAAALAEVVDLLEITSISQIGQEQLDAIERLLRTAMAALAPGEACAFEKVEGTSLFN